MFEVAVNSPVLKSMIKPFGVAPPKLWSGNEHGLGGAR